MPSQKHARSKSRESRDSRDKQEVPTEVNDQSAEISEEACCVLDLIDDVLEEHDDRELTDQEVYDRGRPDFDDYIDEQAYSDLYRNGEKAAAEAMYETAYDEYRAARDRYAQAYENVTGIAFNPCACG